VEDGVTTLSLISSAVSKALDSTACAASILAERTIRDDDGIAMLICLYLVVNISYVHHTLALVSGEWRGLVMSQNELDFWE